MNDDSITVPGTVLSPTPHQVLTQASVRKQLVDELLQPPKCQGKKTGANKGTRRRRSSLAGGGHSKSSGGSGKARMVGKTEKTGEDGRAGAAGADAGMGSDAGAGAVAGMGADAGAGVGAGADQARLPAVTKAGTPVTRATKGVHYVKQEPLAEALQAAGGSNIVVLDMRQPYEFEGGHIREALHVDWRASDSNRKLRSSIKRSAGAAVVAVVIYCEFGGKRSPQAATEAAKAIAAESIETGDVLVLQGGYSRFYAKFPALCDGGYVPEE